MNNFKICYLEFLQVNLQKQKEVSKRLSHSYSSSEESDDSSKDTKKKLNKIVKSEQKNKIVRNIFLNVSKSDGGAKGKGQVMIVDHSEDSQKPMTNLSREHSSPIPNTNEQDSRLFSSNPIICRIDLSRLSRIPDGPIFRLNQQDAKPNKLHKEIKVLPKVKSYNHILICVKIPL